MASFVKNCVRGSGTISRWIKDAKAGVCGVDFLVCGDSNTGYGEAATATITDTGLRKYGLLDGFAQAMINNGINLYGSPVYCFTRGSPSFYSGLGTRNAVGDNNISGNNIQNSNASGNIGLLGSATSVETDFSYFYQEMSGTLLESQSYTIDHGTTANWHYLTSNLAYSGTGVNYRVDALQIDSEPWLNEKATAYYRVTHSFTTNGGNTGATVTANGGVLNISPASFILAGNGGVSVNPALKDSEFLLPRAGSAHTLTSGAVSIRLMGFYNTFTAPIGLFFHSIYEKQVGFAISSLYFQSGVRVDQIRDKMEAITTPTIGNPSNTQQGNFIGHHLAAIVRRQKDASPRNKGRVCIILQGGTNASVEGTDAKTRAVAIGLQYRRIISIITEQWQRQKLNQSHLAFVIVSSPVTNNAEMPYLSHVLGEYSGQNIAAIDHAISMPSSEYVSNTYYDAGGTAGEGSATPASHLTETGYIEWGNSLVTNLLKYDSTVKLKRK